MNQIVKHHHFVWPEFFFCVLCCLFATFVVLTNTAGVKLFYVAGMSLPTSCLWYPFTFLITDIVGEFYGERRGYFLVVMGFCLSLLVMLFCQVSIRLPVSPYYPAGAAYHEVFSPTWRLIAASMAAYLLAQAVDVRIFELVHRTTGPRYRWLRNNVSTMVAQLVDTVTVQFLFMWNNEAVFTGTIGDLLGIMAATYGVKVCIALIDTPLFYLVTSLVRRRPEFSLAKLPNSDSRFAQ
ncbi:MAG: queuosine precursor transporter [Zetaproteobacteria bacterium]|nr:queuosine precursor transporter [Zetaproteobacteria bacterium]